MTMIKIYYESCEELLPLSSAGFHPDLLKTLDEMGIITLQTDYISVSDLSRVRRIASLRNRLGVNLIGAAIILDLLDRIE